MAPCTGREQYSVGGIGEPVAEVGEPEAVVGVGTEVVGRGVELGVEVLEGVAWLFSETSVPVLGPL